MKQRLHNLFALDHGAHIRMHGVAIAASWSFGVLLLLTGTSVRDSAINSSVLTFAILSVWIVVYCSLPHLVKRSAPTPLLSRRLAFSSVLFAFASALGLSAGRLNAEIVTRRLRKYATENPVSESHARTMANVLLYAQANRVPVAPSLVSTLGSRLLGPDQANTPSAYSAAQAAAALQSTLHVKATNKGSRFIKLPPGSVFERCYFDGLSFSLDTRAFLGSYIENCTVSYDGGAVVIKNTAFVNCRFEFAESPQARGLLLLLTRGNEPDFSYRANEIFG